MLAWISVKSNKGKPLEEFFRQATTTDTYVNSVPTTTPDIIFVSVQAFKIFETAGARLRKFSPFLPSHHGENGRFQAFFKTMKHGNPLRVGYRLPCLSFRRRFLVVAVAEVHF